MSTKYSGGFITKSPVAPTSSAASGIWTLDQQQQAQKAGTWPSPPMFIEDLFSTYLYTGAGTTQVIPNGVDLSAKGGLVWLKDRGNVGSHRLVDTVRGNRSTLFSDSTSAAVTRSDDVSCDVSSFNSNGFTAGNFMNQASNNYVSWTFQEQPKFFDIVTFTGNNSSPRAISHNLGSAPGCMIVKRIDTAAAWYVYHRSSAASGYTPQECILNLNNTNAVTDNTTFWASTAPTSTVFTVGSSLNSSGATYVAYLFAHDAGGFPVSGGGSTNGISCGSYTTDGSGNFSVNLGYEPQWIMAKRTSSTGDWTMFDTMRGLGVDGTSYVLYANVSNAEAGPNSFMSINSTGFGRDGGTAGQTFIYIAIRRGPMKPPTVGTSVFVPQVVAESTTPPNYLNTITSNFPVDWVFTTTSATSRRFGTRLMGTNILASNSTAAQTDYGTGTVVFDSNISAGIIGTLGSAASAYMYAWRRAPSFMDVVCYTGNSTAGRAITHNLGVTPEMFIVKNRSDAFGWNVYHSGIAIDPETDYVQLNTNAAASDDSGRWNDTAPTSSVFTVGTGLNVNASGSTYVAYLFATVSGVSKVGSYTGTGAAQTINCGFTAGSRFILIKRTDSTGDWYVWDSARGIIPANDPYLLLNSTAAEVTGTDYVDTTNVGFDITSTAPAEINASGGNFIFLAIA